MKSNVSDLLELVSLIYQDACSLCPADVYDLRDLCTIRSRVKHEGLSFLTITLPNFCEGVEAALEARVIDPSEKGKSFRGFPFYSRAVPVFLKGALDHVFDPETGRLIDEEYIPSSTSDIGTYIDCIRQICLAFKKMHLPCTPEREKKAVRKYVDVEHTLRSNPTPQADVDVFMSISAVLWDNMVRGLRHLPLLPRHGPGATAEGISGNAKYLHLSWNERLDNYFPLIDYGCSISEFFDEGVDKVPLIPEELELPVKVTLVPKTLKGPRIIAIEPVAMQFAQQGIRSQLYEAIESYCLTAGHINFRDQSINQSLAIAASATGQLATIDLSDASDRVPLDLALGMFDADPEYRDAIASCRSSRARLPSGEVLSDLQKFASMGSALCFPVESMYFYTICVGALLEFRNLPVSHSNVHSVISDLYVYGDDIIVPKAAAGNVLVWLQKYHCKPNPRKTFMNGKFRESCGADAYCGKLVTPVYVRQDVPENKLHEKRLVSWSATANLFFLKGYWRTAEFMHSKCERILQYYPQVSEDASYLGRIYPYSTKRKKFRTSIDRQRLEVKAWAVTPVYRADALDGYPALRKCLLRLESHDSIPKLTLMALAKGDFTALLSPIDERHLERSALHGAVSLKLRWVATQCGLSRI